MTRDEMIQAILDDELMPYMQRWELEHIVDFVIKNTGASIPKIKGWVARFANGSLGISKEKPFYYEADGKTYISGYETVFIDKSLFPELHWLDEPIEVELIIRPV